MSSTKRPRSPRSAESGPRTSKKGRTSRRAAVPDHSKKVRASTLHISSGGRIGRKKLGVARKEVLSQAVSDTGSPTDNPEPLSTECDLDTSLLDSQEIPSKSNAEKNKRSNTNSVNFLLCLSVHLFLTLPFFQTKLLEWLQYRDTYLHEILRGYGLGDSQNTECTTCHSRAGKFRCVDCFPHGPLRCVGCLVDIHRENPLHRIEVCFSECVLLQLK